MVPLSRYNSCFGGKPGSAAKAKRAMIKTYGAKKGTSVFYAKATKGGCRPKKKKRRR